MTADKLPLTVTGGRVPTTAATVYERRDGRLVGRPDRLAVEEPLEVRVQPPGAVATTFSVTMRTPGHDFELVAGFLLSEGVIQSRDDVAKIAYCLDEDLDAEQRYNVVTAELNVPPGPASLARHVMTSSACGVCGSASIDAVRIASPPAPEGPLIELDALLRFPEQLRAGQRAFETTGGLHGIGLMTPDGSVLALREDVGRHNAVDKVVGWALLAGLVPLSQVALVVSGRISFEIVQKAARAGIAVVAAVSAATSLAVRLAEEQQMTLVGFVRGDRCTVYTGRQRLVVREPVTTA